MSDYSFTAPKPEWQGWWNSWMQSSAQANLSSGVTGAGREAAAEAWARKTPWGFKRQIDKGDATFMAALSQAAPGEKPVAGLLMDDPSEGRDPAGLLGGGNGGAWILAAGVLLFLVVLGRRRR